MKSFKFQIEVKANSKEEAIQKAEALATIAGHVSGEDLTDIAEAIADNPEIVEMAKTMFPKD